MVAPSGTRWGLPNESSFTSFSELGAAIPSSSEGDHAPGSPVLASSTSLLTLSGLRTLLHPSSTPAQTSIRVASERTPLLHAVRQRRRKTQSRCYVGGRDAFGQVEEAADSTSLDGQEMAHASMACRECEADERPISGVTLAVIAQALFALMSLLAEVLAREAADRRMSQAQIMAIQTGVTWAAAVSVLACTGTKHA